MTYYDPMIFCQIVKERNPARRTKFIEIAKKIWTEEFSRSRGFYSDCNADWMLCTKFESCCRQYDSLHSSIQAYLADPLTVAFLSETGPPPRNNPNERVTHQDAVDKMYTHGRCLGLLRSGIQVRSCINKPCLVPTLLDLQGEPQISTIDLKYLLTA